MKSDERPEDRPPTATKIITPGAVGVSETAQLLDSVAVFVRSYVVLSEAQLTTVVLWNLHCHAFDASDYTPYLFVTSAERESGKSRLKEVCELLVPKPISTMNVSTAALFRLAGENPPPTFLIDELDQIFAPKSERAELRGLRRARSGQSPPAASAIEIVCDRGRRSLVRALPLHGHERRANREDLRPSVAGFARAGENGAGRLPRRYRIRCRNRWCLSRARLGAFPLFGGRRA